MKTMLVNMNIIKSVLSLSNSHRNTETPIKQKESWNLEIAAVVKMKIPMESYSQPRLKKSFRTF